MFDKLKEKLKGALSIFSKKAEEQAEVKPAPKISPPEKKAEKKEEKKIAIKTKEISEEEKKEAQRLIEQTKKEFAREELEQQKKEVLAKYGPQKEIKAIKKPEEIKKEESPKEAIAPEIVEPEVSPSEVKITYFVHGTTTDNEKEISSGWHDAELSELGTKQSLELKDKLKAQHFDFVFCSDLKRAADSAKLTFGNKVKIIYDSRLRECDYGKYNGQPSQIVEPLQEKYIYEPFPKGESYEDVKKRVAEFLQELSEKYAGKSVAIVSHKAPQLALDVLLKKRSWEEAFKEDWRKRKAWQPGWNYILKEKISSEKEEKPAIAELTKIKEDKEEKKGFFGKLKEAFTTKFISAEKFQELFWELELALLENNVSVEVIEKIKEDLKKELVDQPLPRNVEAKIEETLRRTLQEILTFEKRDLLQEIRQKRAEKKEQPYVIAFFGINGSGKTTSIAKLANYFLKRHLSVVLAAGDTFRAAAIQQLEEHARKLGVKIIKHDYGSDAAAVAYDAVKYAEKNNIDVVMIDTAGRQHSNTNLMAELEKIIRVTHPHLKLFVGESITGNDCIEQARRFQELIDLDGSILTKADVDEKGGAPLSIAYTIKKPIFFLGTGQKYEDLEEFEAQKILKNLGF